MYKKYYIKYVRKCDYNAKDKSWISIKLWKTTERPLNRYILEDPQNVIMIHDMRWMKKNLLERDGNFW